MHLFLARQPILNREQKIVGYEIFYRSGFANLYTGKDHDEATSKVILDTFNNLGLDTLTAGKPAFINFTTALLEREVATLFPNSQLVVEVLESVRGSQEVLERCRELKQAGYTIALDDFVYNEESKEFLELADIVKIDLIVTNFEDAKETIKRLRGRDTILLAEKVETYEDFRESVSIGFKMFQGYFFYRPEMVLARSLAPLHIVCLGLIREVNRRELDFDRLAQIISRDLSLSYSLVRLANSAAFAKRHPIRTVKHALVFLGHKEIKKWVSLIALRRMCNTELEAPIVTSLVRGRFAELLAEHTEWKDIKDTLFLSGLFSLLDVLLQRPLLNILREVQASEEIIDLLVYRKGPFKQLGRLILAYEQGRWQDVEASAKILGLDHVVVAESYLAALEWCPATPL